MSDSLKIQDLRRRVESDPTSLAFADLAEAYRRAGDFGAAVSVCRAGLVRHPTHLPARVTLGWALLELGYPDQAQSELYYVLQTAPDSLAPLRALAESHQYRGDLHEAFHQLSGVDSLIHDADARSLAEFDRALETLDAVTLDVTPDPVSTNPVLTELELWMAAILADRSARADRA